MEVKQLLKNKLYKASAVLGLSLLSFTSQAQTNVSVDASDTWFTGVLCYSNPQQEYLWYDGTFPIDALKTVLNTTNNTVTLYPNYSAWGEGTDSYWVNGNVGNKYMLTLSYVSGDQLVGQNFTFSGNVSSYTLANGWTAKAFVKIMDATYSTTIAEIVEPITTTGNFTVAYNATNIPADSHIQYGFQVYGLNGNPASEATNGNVVIEADDAVIVEPGDTNVSINATTPNLIAYANWFQLDGTTYVSGSPWAVADVKTVLNTDGSVDLHPNFSQWGNGTDAYWVANGQGAKVFEGNTYIDNTELLGETVTFSGHCFSNTLADGYDAIAFIKVLSGDYQLVNYTHVPLVAGEDFTITVGPGDYTNGAHFQYGYSVTGVNANPANETALGFAKVGAATASVKDFTKGKVVMYPNPASSILNISAENAIDTVEVYNLLGQMVLSSKPANNAAALNVSNLTSGVYIVNTTVAGKQTSARFVKQ